MIGSVDEDRMSRLYVLFISFAPGLRFRFVYCTEARLWPVWDFHKVVRCRYSDDEVLTYPYHGSRPEGSVESAVGETLWVNEPRLKRGLSLTIFFLFSAKKSRYKEPIVGIKKNKKQFTRQAKGGANDGKINADIKEKERNRVEM